MKHLALAITLSFGLPLAVFSEDQNPGNTVEKAAVKIKTGQTIEHGAQATGETIKHGTQATERTVGKGLKNTGNTLEKAGTGTKKSGHHDTSKQAKAKPSPSPASAAGAATPTPAPTANP